MNLIKLNIRGISYSQNQAGAYALILEEELGDRKIPIIIGNFEAQAIAIALEQDLKISRPLTHDLFVKFCKSVSATLISVIIYKLEEGVFFSTITFEDKEGEIIQIDSRTSDAIALAVRFNAPIYAYKHVVDRAGVSMHIISEEEEKEVQDALNEIEEQLKIEPNEKEISWSGYTISQLKKMMNRAVEEEDYELAAKVRDELEKRENK